ncbi:MAG TPA: hypothetical protein VNE63_14695 [Candidatus Acidoferrales bacterium]|nr:hypothetical protein [Candidatus Acidoferrales bacterium]
MRPICFSLQPKYYEVPTIQVNGFEVPVVYELAACSIRTKMPDFAAQSHAYTTVSAAIASSGMGTLGINLVSEVAVSRGVPENVLIDEPIECVFLGQRF